MTIKLYEATQTRGNTTYIGLVLVGDHNQIYMTNCFSTNREKYPYLSGIERAVSFIHHNKPIHSSGDIMLYGQKIGLNDPIKSEYTEKIMPNKRVIPNSAELTEFDKLHLRLAEQEIEQILKPMDIRAMTQNVKEG